MKERPLLFNGAMVRAILDGSKTQTRRVCKPPTGVDRDHWMPDSWRQGFRAIHWPGDEAVFAPLTCPYGQPGDRLWVRETCRAEELPAGEDGVRYLADDTFNTIADTQSAADKWLTMHWYRGRRAATVPPIHMPRWASRIDLLIKSVRVERLQDISDADSIAEGIDRTNTSIAGYARQRYMALWEATYGAGSWETNPWVWVIEFERIKP